MVYAIAVKKNAWEIKNLIYEVIQTFYEHQEKAGLGSRQIF